MSDTVILALVASIAPTVAAVGAIFIGVRNSRKSDTIINKATEIHTLTNSSLSDVQAALEVATEKILGLEKLIASKAENDAQELLTAAVVAASKRVNDGANQPNGNNP